MNIVILCFCFRGFFVRVACPASFTSTVAGCVRGVVYSCRQTCIQWVARLWRLGRHAREGDRGYFENRHCSVREDGARERAAAAARTAADPGGMVRCGLNAQTFSGGSCSCDKSEVTTRFGIV